MGSGRITGLLPSHLPRILNEALDLGGVASGEYKLALRVPNKLPNRHPLQFANRTQHADVPGRLTLGTLAIGSDRASTGTRR